MSFKEQIINNTLSYREKIERQKTMYDEFYKALKIEENILSASQKGEGCIIIESIGYFHFDSENNTFDVKETSIGSTCSVNSILTCPLFISFLKTHEKLQGFDVYWNFLSGLVIKWTED